MTIERKKYFSAEGYRRLARNPFVDENMLQFIRRKASLSQQDIASVPRRKGSIPSSLSGASVKQGAQSQPQMSDQAAKLIAAVLKNFLRE